jgi:hypothetical protein
MEMHEDNMIHYFRLKSTRRRKRLQKLDSDKALLRLYREERALSKEIRNLGYEELNPPVQRGWKRMFVLREDVARTKESKFFLGILEKINTIEYSSRKDFKVKRRKYGRKYYADEPQELVRPDDYGFSKMKFSEKEKAYFVPTQVYARHRKGFITVYVFTEPWRFVLRIQPNIITRVKKKDWNLEQRRDEIARLIDGKNLRDRLWKFLNGSVQWRGRYAWSGDLKKYRDPYANKPFTMLLDDHRPEQKISIENENPRIDRGFCFYVKIRLKLIRFILLFAFSHPYLATRDC